MSGTKNRAGAPTRVALTALSVLMAAGPAAAAIRVDVNGQPVSFGGVQPMQIGGRVFIPLRAVAESLGADVRWDAATRTVYGSREGQTFRLPMRARTAFVNGRTVSLDAPARSIAGRTVVPLRFVAEALGAQVGWSSARQLVSVNMPNAVVAGQRQEQIVIPPNTVVRVELDQRISSATARVGDHFTARVDEDDRSHFPQGSRLEGRITQVQKATKDKPGLIDMRIDRAVLPDGATVPVNGSLSSLDEEHVRRTKDGRLEAKRGAKSGKFDLKWVGIGAAGGAVLGQVLGDGNLLKGALVGALGGAVYSYLNKDKARGDFRDVDLAAGTEFGVRLNQRVAFADRR